jgi:hypothetical protein
MGLFRKKPDPISERAKLLNNQIAALEAEIQRLAEQKETPPPSSSPFADPSIPTPAAPAKAAPERPPAPKSPQPRLRSTAVPHGLNVPAASPSPAPIHAHEPIFEHVDQDRIQSNSEPVTPAHFNELGVRKYDMASAWKRVKTHFRGPVASNPKLVHYLSAGSIQGLRPLRYEKRVARNRFIVLAVFLVLALWGIIAIFISRK